MKPTLTGLIDRAPWREAVTYRDTWPHEYVLTEKDNQRELLDAICTRFPRWRRRSVVGFFRMNNTYLFIGDYKYWLMTGYNDIDPYNDEGDYVINRARLYRDRRDFVIQPGDTGKPEDYPVNPASQAPVLERVHWKGVRNGETYTDHLCNAKATISVSRSLIASTSQEGSLASSLCTNKLEFE